MELWEAEAERGHVRAAVRRLLLAAGPSTNGPATVLAERRRGGRRLKEHRCGRVPLVLTSRSRDGEVLATERCVQR